MYPRNAITVYLFYFFHDLMRFSNIENAFSRARCSITDLLVRHKLIVFGCDRNHHARLQYQTGTVFCFAFAYLLFAIDYIFFVV